MPTTDTLSITTVTHVDQLFHKYTDRERPQECHIELDLETGEMSADYNPEVGDGGSRAMPISVFLGRTRRWSIPILSDTAANRLMQDIAPLARRVLAGATIEWDGNNDVGRLDTDAQDAEDEIRAICDPENGDWEDQDQVCEIEAGDWTLDMVAETIERLELTADSTDADLLAMEAAEIAMVAAHHGTYGHVVLTKFGDWLRGQREDLRNAVGDDLQDTAEQIAELEQRRDATIRRMHSWGEGWSTRRLGVMIGRSHRWIQRVIKQADSETAETVDGE